MDLKNHFFLTCAALFFLGLIFSKPGQMIQAQEARECRLSKGKMDCSQRMNEYRMNDSREEVTYQIVEGKK